MKKVGFIDYYLDEFHANNYPKWIKEASKGELEVAGAYALCDAPNGLTTKQWGEKHRIPILSSIDALIASCDCINVLSPDNPEMHEKLCEAALKSQKPVYIDKTFAETADSARRIFQIAEASGTPCFSASALRFANEFQAVNRENIEHIVSYGPGFLQNYSIHQIEPLIMLMGRDVAGVRYIGTENWPSILMEWRDGRRAEFSHHGWECPFGMHIDLNHGKSSFIQINSDYFNCFIYSMVDFFLTGNVKVSHDETIAVIAVRESVIKSAQVPGQWVAIN